MVSHGKSMGLWKSMPRSAPGPLTTFPSTTTLPSSYGRIPATMLSNVDLPQPDGPSRQTNSPSLTVKFTSVSALTFLPCLRKTLPTRST